jgi:hypothetical protein
MLSRLIRVPAIVMAVAAPLEMATPEDVIDPEIKTAKSFARFQDTETGFDRLKRMFQVE